MNRLDVRIDLPGSGELFITRNELKRGDAISPDRGERAVRIGAVRIRALGDALSNIQVVRRAGAFRRSQ